ncbi:MAG: hypothetical protein GY856_12775 [bacterium]|nr:hypothetical protein [bacterium]
MEGWDIKPQAMIGSSIGECTAACPAGVLSLDDALALVVERGRLMQETESAAMLPVPSGAEELAPSLGEELSVATAAPRPRAASRARGRLFSISA